LFDGTIQYVIDLSRDMGLLGIGIGMFLESMGIPFGSIPLIFGSGYLLNEGKASYITLVFVSAAGSTLGSIVSYYVGYHMGNVIRRYNKKDRLVRHEKKVQDFIKKYGRISIVFAQLFGPTRTFISLPAGALKMNIREFVVGTLVGAIIFAGAMVSVSSLLQQVTRQIAAYLGIPVWLSFALAVFSIVLLIRLYVIAKNLNGDSEG